MCSKTRSEITFLLTKSRLEVMSVMTGPSHGFPCSFISSRPPQYQHCLPQIDFLFLELRILELIISHKHLHFKGKMMDIMVLISLKTHAHKKHACERDMSAQNEWEGLSARAHFLLHVHGCSCVGLCDTCVQSNFNELKHANKVRARPCAQTQRREQEDLTIGA